MAPLPPPAPGAPTETPASVFERAFHASPAMQTITRASDRVLIAANDTFLRTLGYQREEIVGTVGTETIVWVHPEKSAAFRAELQSRGFIRGFELEIYTKDRRVLTVLLSADLVEIGGAPHVVAAGVDITARQRAETEVRATHEKLRQSEERFSKAFHANPAVVALTRLADGVFLSVNDSFLRHTGYAETEVLGRTTQDLGLHVTAEQRESFMSAIAERGSVRECEFVIRRKDGTLTTLLVSGERFEIDGVAHLLTVGLDISARKDAEARLRASEQRLRESEARFMTAFRASPAMIALTRLDNGQLVSVNQAFLELSGYTEAEAIGKTTVELGIYAQEQKRDQFLDAIREHGSVRDHEFLLRTKTGELRTMLLSTESVELDGVPHLLTVGLDITARTQTEARLRESELRLRESEAQLGTAFHASPVLMTIGKLADGRFLEVNDAFIQTMGLTRAETIGRNSLELDVWVDADERAQFFQRVMAARSLRNVDCRMRRRDGAILTCQVSAEIVEINRVPHLLTFGVDITARRAAEAEQANALRRERELSQLKTDFVALVSHEFRTPLEIIMSSVDNLDRYHDRLPAEKRQELLQTVKKSVRRMAGMMEDVLLLGRFDAGGTEFRPKPIELPAFCQRVRDEMASATSQRCPIALAFEGAEATLADARGDEAVLRHILTNLLSNAVKYSEPGQTAELTVRRDGRNAVFRIRDQGRGIPAEDQQRLFQAFHRGSNVRQTPGTGLGLLIVQRCVDLHGGAIQFESAEGRGTTFTVWLPLFAA